MHDERHNCPTTKGHCQVKYNRIVSENALDSINEAKLNMTQVFHTKIDSLLY